MAPEHSGSSLGEAYRAAAPYLGLGVEFAAAVLVCLFAGRWLDERWGTTPFLLLGGILLGMTAGFVHFFRAVSHIQASRKPGDPGDGESSGERN